MQSPWVNDDFRYPQRRGESRGSLGQFIERSTSAPPLSSESSPPHDALVGSDLLDHVTRGGYDRHTESVSAQSITHHHEGSDDFGGSLFLNAANGRSTAPLSYNHEITRPLSASGMDATEQHSFEQMLHIQRPHTAAPSLYPPPGLTLTDSFRRSASTGVIGSEGTALRPAAKTLMDLIQEDFVEDPPDDRRLYINPDLMHGQRSWQQPHRDEHATGSGLSHFRQSNKIGYENATGTEDNTHRQTFHQQQQQQQLPHMNSQTTNLQQMHRVPSMHTRQQQTSDSQQRIPQQQQIVQQQVYFNGPQSNERMQATGPGQPVYVNTAPNQQYSFATVQYAVPQQPQQQQQLLPQLQGGRNGDHFVSVVPMQSSNHMAYWQQDSTGPTIAPVAIVSSSVAAAAANNNPPAATNKAHSMSDGGQYGRSQKNAGRGRRGSAPRRGDPKPHPSSSPLLEEFRLSKNRDWSIFRIEGHVVEFCQDQNGSRFIQQRLELGDSSEQDMVMREVLPAIRRLRNDVFGNYVIQKLLDFGTEDMKMAIRKTMEGEMLQMSLQMYGCRVVQKALESLREEEIPGLLIEFHHNVLSCIHDQNGNHVIQKCIEVISIRSRKAFAQGDGERGVFLSDQIEFIIHDVLVNTATLSCHPYGCRVLQRILEHSIENKKTAILDEISKSHKRLLDDQYGNYVIQHVLQFGRESDRDSILHIVVENGLLGLSRQKFASNVVEKLLKYGNGPQRRAIVREMLKKVEDQSINSRGSGKTTVVLLMVRDAYANYVVQTTLDVVPESQEKQLLVEELNAHSEELRNYTFAKHIVTKLASMNNSG